MLTVGDKLPMFRVQAVVGAEPEFQEITAAAYPGKWLVLFSWPMDFTFVCPTEIAGVGRQEKEFAAHDAQVLGRSTDPHYVHPARRQQHPDLKTLPFPMLADTKRELS